MDITTYSVGGYAVILISESVRKYEDVVFIKKKINEIVDNGQMFIAINLSKVDYMHSFFIKILTSSYKKLVKSGGDIVLIGPNEFIRNLINLLNIHKYITVFENDESFREFVKTHT
ncbi:MAG: hypothetical protein A2268_08785 [Candidatus Raymondbacteria bacterium RifOxyA12_full_50_37]|uniref:STAS domain-containing protein n=1 Tax=Candidatus Raymondbacteria bacterium RIFOXYD12_FULL_49_13 TaxID=1817890 RepID=A0A1F7FG87_UNCRA|nr:MAG: hypothetical protein A2350_19705 [Candidatus Raymondbacteria bacterium RifOxyB12_full_50_8]OGJ91588.1 MAG: hypothetical protein A2268_08785 [Candidatus Raymondbacteria bacterium RifOxyA12_full_50_37]OGJ92894.1 MAG: hypothetical protein A2248_08485 [Candidatus Raymondbacteria bacterium RIFOXYA2_FULL_49_16]OGJ94821.1 MAG: hypothetical protein A2487_03185 [Candidatus Raymondbacteria bacterium RifOxyC12_full_50_8]OGK05720.1 MAG: hypothetical protein A2519_03985 [Candidatus Raymondbacteria b